MVYHWTMSQLEMNFDRGIVEYRFVIPAFAKLDSMIKELSELKDIRKIQIE